MVGDIEKQNLRRANEQRGFHPRHLLRQAAFETKPDEMAERAEPAQHGGHQRPGERAIAVREGCESGIGLGVFELLIERAAPPQYAIDNVRRYAADGEPGHVGRCLKWTSHLFLVPHRSFRLAAVARLRQVRGNANRSDHARIQRAGGTPSCAAKKTADAGSRAGARRSRRAPCRAGPRAHRSTERDRRPRRPRADPLWRLGGQRPYSGLLARTREGDGGGSAGSAVFCSINCLKSSSSDTHWRRRSRTASQISR